MRGRKNLFAVLGTVFILVLAGGMVATGAVAQDDGTGVGTGAGTVVGTVQETVEETVQEETVQEGDGGGGEVQGDDDGDGAADTGGGDGGGDGVTLARTGFPVAIFVLVGSVLLAAGFAGRGRRKS